MRSIFSRLFNNNHVSTTEPDAGPEKDLFIASEPPDPKPVFKGSIIKQFINLDHYSAGLTAGFEIHDKNDLGFQKNCLTNKFQHAVSSIQEQMQEELLDKQERLIQIGDLLPTQKELLDLGIKNIEDKLEALNTQKELSVDGEGWVGQVLNEFERGYKKGLQDFVNERSFLSRHII